MCVSCGELIGIIEVAVSGEGCVEYSVTGTYAQGAVTMTADNGSGSGIYYGDGGFNIDEIPCGESVTIQLINDQDCVSASKTITYDCCPTTYCKEQTLTINAAECIIGRFTITAEDFYTCFTLAPWDINAPSNTSAWETLASDLKDAIKECKDLGCCYTGDVNVEASFNGDFVTLTITDSPITFTSITITGGGCNNDVINFEHGKC